jgi:hypothetical protein
MKWFAAMLTGPRIKHIRTASHGLFLSFSGKIYKINTA